MARDVRKRIAMIGPSSDGKGGISTVVTMYQQEGLFERLGIIYLKSHSSRSKALTANLFLRAVARLVWMLINRRIALVHVHMSVRGSLLRKAVFCAVARMFRTPFIVHLHIMPNGRMDCISLAVVKLLFRKARRVIVLSQAMAGWAAEIEPSTRVEIVYNSIHAPRLPLLVQEQRVGLLFLGRVIEAKGVFDLVDAYSLIADDVSPHCLSIGGDGDLQRLHRLILDRSLTDRVHTLGWVRGEEKERLLSRSAVYVLPSYDEGLPMALLEAMAHGLAIVAAPVGGIPEAIEHDVNGYLVRPGDVLGLAKVLRSLLHSAEDRARLSFSARATLSSRFSPEKVLPSLERIYRDILKEATS